jgi:outer membrane protein, multidrug efflux system
MKFARHDPYTPVRIGTRLLRSILPVLVIGVALMGCAAVGPDYTPVKQEAPSKWQTEMAGGLSAVSPDPESLSRWWTIFNDPQLSGLVTSAAKGNLDLKTARARIREARAQRGIRRAGLFPTLSANAGAANARSSESGGKGTENELYAAGFDAGWELDIFGGVRRSIEAAEADLGASRENLNDVLVSLLAEVALNYVEVRTYQARLMEAEANIRTLQDTYEMNQSLYQAGIIGELALQESLRILESTRSTIPSLETALEAAKNRLAVLIGEPPGRLHQELAEKEPIPSLPTSVAVGIPAETLRRRPDIRRAERNLAAQTARIGQATADLYPKFRLVGTIGLESIESSDFLDWGSRFWYVGPSATWNIFNAGAIRQNIEVQSARQEQALIQYQATVLGAQEEVENTLVAYAKEQRRRESLARATVAGQRAELLARDRYQAGLVAFNNVLDAQRALLLLQDDLAQSTGTVAANLVRLYKALGGGWAPAAPLRTSGG